MSLNADDLAVSEETDNSYQMRDEKRVALTSDIEKTKMGSKGSQEKNENTNQINNTVSEHEGSHLPPDLDIKQVKRFFLLLFVSNFAVNVDIGIL